MRVVSGSFPDFKIDKLKEEKSGSQAIYYLDYCKVFQDTGVETVETLLSYGLLEAGDHFLVTSSLNPFVFMKPAFMDEHSTRFKTYFGVKEVDTEFKTKNHVDLLVTKAFLDHKQLSGFGDEVTLPPELTHC